MTKTKLSFHLRWGIRYLLIELNFPLRLDVRHLLIETIKDYYN